MLQLTQLDLPHVYVWLRRMFAFATLTAITASCTGRSDGPTSTDGRLGFSATSAIMSSSRRGGLLEAELLLDGVRVDSRSFQPAETGLVILQVSDRFIAPGAHRLSLRVVRQATSPSSWEVQIGALVLNLATFATQEFKLPNDIQTVTLADGQMTTLQFTVNP